MEKDECEKLCESIYGACRKDPSLTRRLPADAIWIIADHLMKYAIDLLTLDGMTDKYRDELRKYHGEIYAWWDKYYPRAARRDAKRASKLERAQMKRRKPNGRQ